MLSSVNPLRGDYTAMRQNAARRKNQIGGDSFAAAAGNVIDQGNIHVRLPGENWLYSGGDGKGQDYYIEYAAGSTQEDPIVRITGHSLSGDFDQTVHLNDIDPRNATYPELQAVIHHMQKTGAYTLSGKYTSAVSLDVERGDFAQRQNFVQKIQNNIHHNQRYNPAMAQDGRELLAAYEKFAAGKVGDRAVYGAEQVDALLDSAGYARVADMDAATLYDKLSDISRNVLNRIKTGRNDITREEWTAFCKELRDLGAITDKGFNSARADHKLIPLGYDFRNGGRVSYGSPPGMKDKLKSLYESGLSGKHFGITTTDDWSGDPIAYFDAWFETMQKWRDDLANQKNPDGTPKYDSFAPIDEHIGAWAEVSALLNDLMGRNM